MLLLWKIVEYAMSPMELLPTISSSKMSLSYASSVMKFTNTQEERV
jgi:hypothetical protein